VCRKTRSAVFFIVSTIKLATETQKHGDKVAGELERSLAGSLVDLYVSVTP
jgi:hypothetical protein